MVLIPPLVAIPKRTIKKQQINPVIVELFGFFIAVTSFSCIGSIKKPPVEYNPQAVETALFFEEILYLLSPAATIAFASASIASSFSGFKVDLIVTVSSRIVTFFMDSK